MNLINNNWQKKVWLEIKLIIYLSRLKSIFYNQIFDFNNYKTEKKIYENTFYVNNAAVKWEKIL